MKLTHKSKRAGAQFTLIPGLGSLISCFEGVDKTGEERNMFIFKDKLISN